MLCNVCGFDADKACENNDCPLREAAEQSVARKMAAPALTEELFQKIRDHYASIRRRPKNWQLRFPKPVDFDAWTKKQQEGVSKVWSLWESGVKRICGVGVTGFGKTNVAIELARQAHEKRLRWLFLTHRRLLFGQTHKRFMRDGVDHGCRAAGYEDYYQPDKPGQIAMIPSERASVKELEKRDYHDAQIVIWDETHANKAGFAAELHNLYHERGACQLGLTATPAGIGHLYDEMLFFGRPSEMRAIGAVVPFQIYAPDEVDLKDVARVSSGEFSRAELGRRFTIQRVVGSVIDHFVEYNPEARPSLLFAPDVQSSIWFTDQFIAAGITAAHVDGNDCYLGEKDENGQPVIYKSSPKMREFIEGLHHDGIVTIVCNRFVFLMGVDWPWTEHVVFATAFGTCEMWIQGAGRGGRQYVPSGKDKCIIQDHGGNWHRHPSPNSDIPWNLETTNESIAADQKAARESGKEHEPVLCPKCRRPQRNDVWIRLGNKCVYPDCGFMFEKSVRVVIQTDGKLKRVSGPVAKKKKAPVSEGQKLWNNLLFRSRNSKSTRPMNFRQAVAVFEKAQDRFIIQDRGPETTILDRQTNHTTKLGFAPPPGSELWNEKVRDVPIWKLQRS